MSVTIRSESGKTVIETTKDDPRFATILSMYDVHGIPDVVIVLGSPGEILDEEYENLMRLDDYVSAKKRGEYDEPVDLSEVNRIQYVLDLGDEINYTFVDRDTSQKDRLRHYKLLYQTLSEEERDVLIPYKNLLPFDSYLSSIITEITRHDVPPELIGLLYNNTRGTGVVHLVDITWEDIPLIVDIRHKDILNAVLLLGGEGNLNDEIMQPLNSFWKDDERIFILDKILPLIPDAFFLSDNFLFSVGSDLRPILRSTNQPLSLAKYLLNHAIRTTYRGNPKSPISYGDVAAVEKLEGRIGRQALVRVLLYILYMIEAGKSDKSMDDLAAAIEEYLNK